jgi:hypothetical protein
MMSEFRNRNMLQYNKTRKNGLIRTNVCFCCPFRVMIDVNGNYPSNWLKCCRYRSSTGRKKSGVITYPPLLFTRVIHIVSFTPPLQSATILVGIELRTMGFLKSITVSLVGLVLFRNFSTKPYCCTAADLR